MNNPPTISVLLPTRGRPAQAQRAIASLLASPFRDKLRVLVGVDEDDTAFPLPEGAAAVVGPRLPTLGWCANRIAAQADGDILIWFGDDQVVDDANWVRNVWLAVGKSRVATIYYLKDPLHPNLASMPVVPRWMVDVVGFWWAPWFPYWFGDTWWDEIGELIGSKVGIEVGLRHPEGRGLTRGLRDLGFWVELFEALRPMRVQQAYAILEKSGGAVTADGMRARAALCAARVAHLRGAEFLAEQASMADVDPPPGYAEVKAAGEKMLAGLRAALPRVAVAIPSQATWVARTGAAIAGLCTYSAVHGIEIGVVTAECSMISKGRNDLVRMAMEIGASHILFIDSDMVFPPAALQRLLAADKDIVGATYCKRVPPYPALGRLMPPVPTDIRGGPVVEAEYLPGGMLLVRMEVFHKLAFPWFFETVRWGDAGATGSEMLKEMLRQVFSNEPPVEALASLDGTALAAWIDDAWKVEGAGEWVYVSEDISFCKKARRGGYRVWCDLGLTFQMKHVGAQEVTSRLPDAPEAREAAE